LADAITPRYRALVFLATFASLRWAELAARCAQDIDIDTRTVRVTRQISYPRRRPFVRFSQVQGQPPGCRHS
jgi:hypothetical protein